MATAAAWISIRGIFISREEATWFPELKNSGSGLFSEYSRKLIKREPSREKIAELQVRMKLPRATPPPLNLEVRNHLLDAMHHDRLVAYAKKFPLTPAHFLIHTSTFYSPLEEAVLNKGYVAQIAEALKPPAEGFTCRDFLEGGYSGALILATEWNHLDQVFTPSLWACRVGEMEKLSSHVPQEELKKIGYQSLFMQAILLSAQAAPKFSLADFFRARRGGEGERQENHRLSTRDRT